MDATTLATPGLYQRIAARPRAALGGSRAPASYAVAPRIIARRRRITQRHHLGVRPARLLREALTQP